MLRERGGALCFGRASETIARRPSRPLTPMNPLLSALDATQLPVHRVNDRMLTVLRLLIVGMMLALAPAAIG